MKTVKIGMKTVKIGIVLLVVALFVAPPALAASYFSSATDWYDDFTYAQNWVNLTTSDEIWSTGRAGEGNAQTIAAEFDGTTNVTLRGSAITTGNYIRMTPGPGTANKPDADNYIQMKFDGVTFANAARVGAIDPSSRVAFFMNWIAQDVVTIWIGNEYKNGISVPGLGATVDWEINWHTDKIVFLADGNTVLDTSVTDPVSGSWTIPTTDHTVFTQAATNSVDVSLDGIGWTAVSELAFLTGDANGDGVVSAGDYASVQANFGNTGDPGILGDANGDGVVSAGDYASVQANFGNTAPAQVTPEPTTISLLALAALAITKRQRG